MLDPLALLLRVLFFLCTLHSLASSNSLQDAASCNRLSLAEIFLPPPRIGELVASVSLVHRVLELNESTMTLEQTLTSLWAEKEESNVMLFLYASWCPFSKLARPLFETMSALYPSLHHIAVEESSVRPSVLSKYGVHSFPTLLHLTPGSTSRFHGSKDLDNLVEFYKSTTGFVPDIQGSSVSPAIDINQRRSPKEVQCPYPQAISPERWLHDDMYLALAICFLSLRLALYVLPVAAKNFRWWWKKVAENLSSPCSPRRGSNSPHSPPPRIEVLGDGNPAPADFDAENLRRNRPNQGW